MIFFAKISLMNMCAIMSFPIEERVRKENQASKTKYDQRLNKTSVVATLKEQKKTKVLIYF